MRASERARAGEQVAIGGGYTRSWRVLLVSRTCVGTAQAQAFSLSADLESVPECRRSPPPPPLAPPPPPMLLPPSPHAPLPPAPFPRPAPRAQCRVEPLAERVAQPDEWRERGRERRRTSTFEFYPVSRLAKRTRETAGISHVKTPRLCDDHVVNRFLRERNRVWSRHVISPKRSTPALRTRRRSSAIGFGNFSCDRLGGLQNGTGSYPLRAVSPRPLPLPSTSRGWTPRA
ncbi:hypothetical protein PUN28_007355 [Cardiocondyla obscurior]|uniref:Uncharacterized protein n=1 Tax=Cardiocondyla obscurior TaxID=286306 RepID=A0AAW2G342_9HYME